MEDNNSKEINLLQLLALIFNWLKKTTISVLRFFGNLLKISYRHKWIFISFAVVAIAAAFYLTRPAARVYKAEGTAMLYACESRLVKECASQLENLSEGNKVLSYSKILGLPDSVSKNIVQIRTLYVIDNNKDSIPDYVDYKNNHSLTDTLNVRMPDRVYIQLKTKNIKQVKQVETAILNYLNSNEILKGQYEALKEQLLNQIKKKKKETKRIDSLANVAYFKNPTEQIQFENNRLMVGEQKKQLFYEDIYQLNNMKTGAEFALARYKNPVQIPSGMTISLQPINTLPKYLVFSVFISMVLALLLAVFIENFKKISDYLKN